MDALSLFAARRIYSVGELLGQIKKQTEAAFDFVWVQGEISGLRRPASGHFYFSLKDRDGSVRAVMFRHQAGLLRFRLEEGQQVLCQGRISIYVPRGDMQLVVDTAEPQGAGALALAFEQLKRRLAAEGLFDQELKAELPDLPGRVAVVTSPSGAAIRDFLKVVHRRHDRLAVAVYPVPVQGDTAAPQMVTALDELAKWGWPEVIVLTRGGGSPEDLWAFNEETLARAIADCPIPVVSAVGHEVDFTIADLVADLRAPTPSAAAEMLTADRGELVRRWVDIRRRLEKAMLRLIDDRRDYLAGLERGLADPRRRLADKRLRIDDLTIRLALAHGGLLSAKRLGAQRISGALYALNPRLALSDARARHREYSARMLRGIIGRLRQDSARVESLRDQLRALGPLEVLGRGYSLVFDQKGRILRQSIHAKPGQEIMVRLGQGFIVAKVEDVLE